MMGQELHESDEALKKGLLVASYMHHQAKEYTKRHNLKVSLEESPAESATRRFAKVDYRNWPQARHLVKGDVEADEYYYTNSIHLRANAPVDLLTRIQKQAKFHSMIESGAIIHAFVGEERPPTESILALVRRTLREHAGRPDHHQPGVHHLQRLPQVDAAPAGHLRALLVEGRVRRDADRRVLQPHLELEQVETGRTEGPASRPILGRGLVPGSPPPRDGRWNWGRRPAENLQDASACGTGRARAECWVSPLVDGGAGCLQWQTIAVPAPRRFFEGLTTDRVACLRQLVPQACELARNGFRP